jgi:hypothetical protein
MSDVLGSQAATTRSGPMPEPTSTEYDASPEATPTGSRCHAASARVAASFTEKPRVSMRSCASA